MGGVFIYIIPTHKTKVMGLKKKLWFIFLNCAFGFGGFRVCNMILITLYAPR
jgi:hypothetical protein